MSENFKTGAVALIGGSVATIALMALHPVHFGGMNGIVHGTAIVSAPVLAYGGYYLSRFIGRAPAGLAGSLYVFALVASIVAATMSGLVAPVLVEGGAETPRTLWDFERALNQGFAHVYTGLASLAVALWGLAWRGHWGLRGWGVIAGVGILAWQMSGTLTLDVHRMGAVVLLHASFLIAAGVAMLRAKS